MNKCNNSGSTGSSNKTTTAGVALVLLMVLLMMLVVVLTVWFCELHNMVNKDIGHKQFDCNPFHLDMEYLKDCGECEVVKNDGTDTSKALEKAKSGYHPETGPWDSSLYQRDPLLLSSITR